MIEADGARKRFDRRTEKYRSLGFDRLAAARSVAKLAATGSEPALDIGTGKGLLAMALAEHFRTVVSVDVISDDLALAARLADETGLLTRIRYITADASRLPFPDAHFGVVAMMDVLHHLQSAEPILTEAVRMIHPAGLLVLADFTPEGIEIVDRVHREDGVSHFAGPATLDWATEWAERRGLRQVAEQKQHLHRAIVLRLA